MPIILPPSLQPGDKIAIVSPASAVKTEYIEGAIAHLESWGYQPIVMPHAIGSTGSYSASVDDRIEDIRSAFLDHSVKAILCSRGGYGCVHLLPSLAELPTESLNKWLIGFSDVSALHAFMYSRGIASIHGSMAKALALHGDEFEPNSRLHAIMQGEFCPIEWGRNDYNRCGEAEGTLIGGNLAVLQALIGTPYDIFDHKDTILFIEDIAEPIYKVERIVLQLRMAGVFDKIKGLIIGQFTEYHSDRNFSTMEEMLHSALDGLKIPIGYNAPIGHVEGNVPVIEGLPHRLSVTRGGAMLTPLI